MWSDTMIATARDIAARSNIATIRFLTYYTDEYNVYHLQCLDAARRPLRLAASEHAAAATLTEVMVKAAWDAEARRLLPELRVEGEEHRYDDVPHGVAIPLTATITFTEEEWFTGEEPYVYEHDDGGEGFGGPYPGRSTEPGYRADDPYNFTYVPMDE